MPPTKTENLLLQKTFKLTLLEKEKQVKTKPNVKCWQKAIKKERATPLEGSFWTEKEHYKPRTIKARTKAIEILWIFFGIHTPNALEMGRRIKNKDLKKVA